MDHVEVNETIVEADVVRRYSSAEPRSTPSKAKHQ